MRRSLVIVVFCLISNLCFSQEFALRSRTSERDTIAAQYPEGGDAFVRAVTRKFRIPYSVNKYSYEGIFDIHFTINTAGIPAIDSLGFTKMKFRSRKISAGTVQQVQADIRAEMDRVFEQIPEWIPATANGTRIPYRMRLPFSVYFD